MPEYRGTAHQRGYDRRWQKARAAYLLEHPLCAYCRHMGKVRAATVVDHVTPHKGDMVLFWNRDNWQPLCKTCHDSLKQKEEGGKVVGCDVMGMPISPSHHWT
jgi:5-methylcytosine-specific restriction enzyme A